MPQATNYKETHFALSAEIPSEEAFQTLHMCPRALLLEGNIELFQFNLSNVQKLHSQIAELQLPDRNLKKAPCYIIILSLNSLQAKFEVFSSSGW